MSTDTLVLLLIFQKMSNVLNVLFLGDDLMKKVNNFQVAKVQPQGVAQYLLDSLPKKKCILRYNEIMNVKCNRNGRERT